MIDHFKILLCFLSCDGFFNLHQHCTGNMVFFQLSLAEEPLMFRKLAVKLPSIKDTMTRYLKPISTTITTWPWSPRSS